MLVTTATVGESFRNERSDSSASATMKSPLPRRAPEPSTPSRPPTTTVGSRPPWSSTRATIEVVVVLPWLPATATPYLRRISSASISARGITGMPQAARLHHLRVVGLHGGRDVTTTCAPCTLPAAWPSKMPRAQRGQAVGRRPSASGRTRTRCSRGSSAPRRSRSCPSPPIPTKCTCWIFLSTAKLQRLPRRHGGTEKRSCLFPFVSPWLRGHPSSRSATRAAASGRPRRARRLPSLRGAPGRPSDSDDRRGQARRPSGPSPRPCARRRPTPWRAAFTRWWSSAACGEGHQHRRLAGRRQLRAGGGAAAADDEVGRGEARLHVVEERHAPPPRGRRPRRRPPPRRAWPRRSGARCAGGPRPAGAGSAVHHRAVQDARALAAAEDQQRVRQRGAPCGGRRAKPPRTGLPVSTPLRAERAPRLLVASRRRRRTNGRSTRLVKPGLALGSRITVRTPQERRQPGPRARRRSRRRRAPRAAASRRTSAPACAAAPRAARAGP